MPCYNNEPGNEWYLTQQTHLDDFTSYGPNGGSSRLLQNRIYYYSLMSGADFMSEEWGLNCSYNDMNTFELSTYGQAKKDFIDFARDHRQVKAKVPFAFVLPADYPYVALIDREWPPVGQWKEGIYFGRKYTQQEYKQNGRIEDAFKVFYRRKDEDIVGNEGVALQNTRFGDFFDILYEDSPEAAFDKYEALVDLTDDERFTAQNGNKYRIFSGADPYALSEQIEILAKQIMPVYADCCLWLLSEDENGRYVSVFNNEGNERSLEKGDTLIPEADAVTLIHLKEERQLRLVKTSSDRVKLQKINSLTWALELPAAGFAIIQY